VAVGRQLALPLLPACKLVAPRDPTAAVHRCRLGAERVDGKELDPSPKSFGEEPVLALHTDHGELKVVPESAGIRGCDDLRWHATGEHIGKGLRPRVASVDDLARMLAALGREQDMPHRRGAARHPGAGRHAHQLAVLT
jgi:hypothetical protein